MGQRGSIKNTTYSVLKAGLNLPQKIVSFPLGHRFLALQKILVQKKKKKTWCMYVRMKTFSNFKKSKKLRTIYSYSLFAVQFKFVNWIWQRHSVSEIRSKIGVSAGKILQKITLNSVSMADLNLSRKIESFPSGPDAVALRKYFR